jgi:hypothetical protein
MTSALLLGFKVTKQSVYKSRGTSKDGVAPRTDTWDRAREAVSQLVGANGGGGSVEPASPGATPPG